MSSAVVKALPDGMLCTAEGDDNPSGYTARIGNGKIALGDVCYYYLCRRGRGESVGARLLLGFGRNGFKFVFASYLPRDTAVRPRREGEALRPPARQDEAIE